MLFAVCLSIGIGKMFIVEDLAALAHVYAISARDVKI